jgi:hypothetical protein
MSALTHALTERDGRIAGTEDGMSKPTTENPDQHETETYELRLEGHLDPRWAARLAVPKLSHLSDGTTLLGGVAADQAALHGLLQRLRDLGLPLVSIMRIGRGQVR